MEALHLESREKSARYRELLPQLAALVEGEPDLVANLANLSAALKEGFTSASWVGFYRMVGDELVLGPFQGSIACVRIAAGMGVCGASARERRTMVVPDVRSFPGHIACDARTRSEIVVPILRGHRVLGVLDMDSHQPAAFDDADARALEEVARLVASLPWPD